MVHSISSRAFLICLLFGLSTSGMACAQPTRPQGTLPEVADFSPASVSSSLSIGTSSRGRLRRSVALEETESLRRQANRRRAYFGTTELVEALQRTSARVAAVHPHSITLVGDLSRERGGVAHPHVSHRSGRDADIGFMLEDENGEDIIIDRFAHLSRRNACGRSRQGRVCLDADRTLTLMLALLSDPGIEVQYMLIASPLRRRILRAAESRNIPPALLERLQTVTRRHQGSEAHRSHFHLRIYCPENDRPQCIDRPPFHDWYVGTPSPRRVRSQRRRRASGASRTPARRRRHTRAPDNSDTQQ